MYVFAGVSCYCLMLPVPLEHLSPEEMRCSGIISTPNNTLVSFISVVKFKTNYHRQEGRVLNFVAGRAHHCSSLAVVFKEWLHCSQLTVQKGNKFHQLRAYLLMELVLVIILSLFLSWKQSLDAGYMDLDLLLLVQ